MATAGAGAATVLRAPNHLGDVVMALPALETVEADVLVRRWLAPLLQMSRVQGRVIPLDRGAVGLTHGVRDVRQARYRHAITLTPSFSSAAIFAGARIPHRRGVVANSRRWLLTDAIPVETLAGMHRSAAYWSLVTGRTPAGHPHPHLVVPPAAQDRWRSLTGNRIDPTVGVFPGSNASSRRWDVQRFAETVRRLAGSGVRVIVFGGPEERAVTAEAAAGVALDLGGCTDLHTLAAGLAGCDLLLSNDSGPLHLAAAVGTPTLSLVGPSDPNVTSPVGDTHKLLRRPDLPCVPCVLNECPRTGRGYILNRAKRECLRLISVDEVVRAVHDHLGAANTLTPRRSHGNA